MITASNKAIIPKGIKSDTGTHAAARRGAPLASLHPATQVSPAPGPNDLRMLRLLADSSRPKWTGRTEAAMAAAIFPQPGPEAEAEAARTWCADAPAPARNASVRGSRPRATPGSGRAAAMGSAAVESFVTNQLDLLELERDAEVEERRYRRRPVLSPSVRPFPQPCSAHS